MLHRSPIRILALFLAFGPFLPSAWVPPASAAAAPAAAVAAQKLARKAVDCPTEGFKFQPLDKYEAIPVDTNAGGDSVLRFGQGQSKITVLSCGNPEVDAEKAVSYTHLTLPTKRIV